MTNRDNHRVNKLLISLYLTLSAIYIGFSYIAEPGFSTTTAAFLKALPILLLLICSLTVSKPANKALALALFFGGCGDVLLAYGQFVNGLSAFLLGHLVYIVIWGRHFNPRIWFKSVPVIVFGVIASIYLWPYLETMAIPVTVYICVICLMAAFASVSTLVTYWGLLGVYSFLFSDLVIAWNRFVEPVPFEGVLVMFTYYLAQGAICYALVAQTTPDKK